MIRIQRDEAHPIASEEDIVRVRKRVRECAAELGFGVLVQTRLMTAASEIVRNALKYGGGGGARLQVLLDGARPGLRLVVEDGGPGIADVEQALTDGFTTGGGMGLGLGGTRRLVDDFELWSRVGEGTRVTVTQWK